MPDDEKQWQIEMTAAATPLPSEITLRDSQVHGGRIAEPARRARLGPYAILTEIGRGGQGVVYLAEDTRLGRQVALKVLSNLFASDSWTRLRFEREATATARLDHPGICTVYEAGTIDQTPFIAMRLVNGESLSARIANTRTEASQKTSTGSGGSGARQRRDALFAEVEIVEKAARALHVAHEAGLVHRDIKPGNMMVEPSGQPVVLDFGLARDAQAQELLLTGTGTFLGTPPYMSPEQIDATGPVDRRTDVWSLGVILYEIATGTRPFEAPTVEGLLRAIRTTEPPAPRRLNSAVTPELSAVILHALEKDRGNRYPDALALADDLGRARRLESVRARAPSASMRLWRWAQRNPVLAASLAIVFVGLSVALAISLASLKTANDALNREGTALVDARDQRNRAEDLLAFMLVDLKRPLEEVGRLEILGKAARKADDYFASRPLDFEQETETLQRAITLRNVADVVKSQGDVMAATKKYEEALRINEELVRRNPKNVPALREQASATHALSVAAMSRGDRAECLARAEQALPLWKKAAALDPDDCELKALLLSGMVMHANALKFADRSADAIPIYRDAIPRWEALCDEDRRPHRRRDLAVALQNLGEALRQTGDLDGALASRSKGLAVFESMVRDEPQNRDWQEQIATSHHGIAVILNEKKDVPGAIAESKQAVAILRRLVDEDPTNTRRLYQVGVALHQLGMLHSVTGQSSEALDALRESTALRKRLAALDPKNKSWQGDVADIERATGVLLASMGRLREALDQFQASIASFRKLVEEAPDVFMSSRLSDALCRAAQIEGELGRPRPSIELYLAAVRASEASYDPQKPTYRAVRELAIRQKYAAETMRLLGDRKGAVEMQTRNVESRKQLLGLASASQKADCADSLVTALVLLARWKTDDGEAAVSRQLLLEALAAAEAAPKDPKDPAVAEATRADAHVTLAEAQSALLDLAATDQAAERAEELLDILLERKRFGATAAQLRARLDLVRRVRAAILPDGPREPADHEALALHLVRSGRAADSLEPFARGLAGPAASDTIRLDSLATAILTAARVLERAPAEGRPRIESLALDWIRAAVAIRAPTLRKLEARFAEQAKKNNVENEVRDDLWELRTWFAALWTEDPELAPLRTLPGFGEAAETRPAK